MNDQFEGNEPSTPQEPPQSPPERQEPPRQEQVPSPEPTFPSMPAEPTAAPAPAEQSGAQGQQVPQQRSERRDDNRPRRDGRDRRGRGRQQGFRDRQEQRGDRQEQRGDRQEQRGERQDQREERQEPQNERQEQREERQERPERQEQRRGERQDQRRGDRQDQRRGDREPRGEQHHDGRKEVSVVVPLYNEEQSLRELYDTLRTGLGRVGRYEIIFVDDGSTDGSMRVLHELRHRDKRVKIIRFRRNYGKSAALSVGFEHAEGAFVVTMDADLQDDPLEIPNLVNELKKGFDLVSGWKKRRRDPITKTIPSRFFNFVTRVMTGIRLHDFNCGLKAYRREVVKEVQIYGELHRYIPVLAAWHGYKVGEIPVMHRARKYGKTKFGVGRFWKGFLDLLTVLFTTRYLQRPLHLFGAWGLIFTLLGCGVDGYLAYLKIFEGLPLSNRPLFMGGILLMVVGVQFISVGLLGELITKARHANDREYSIRELWK